MFSSKLFPVSAAIFAATIALGSSAQAATDSVEGFIVKVFVHGGGEQTNYGGCMALLTESPSSKLPGCAPGWVTFSCTGDFATNQLQAYRLLDQAQMALVTRRRVKVFFTDDQRHNGYCFAHRIDVF